MIQKRYGWDDEKILSIPYSRLLQIVDEVLSLELEKKKDLLFLGWQLHLFTSMNPITDFDNYCKMFGLANNDTKEVDIEKVSVEEVKKKTEDILNLFKEKGGEKVNGII